MRRFLVVLSTIFGCAEEPRTPGVTIALVDEQGDKLTDVEFGLVAVGQARALTLRVINRGVETTGALAVSVGGPHANDFTIDDVLTTCAGAELVSAGRCDVGIAFRPVATGARTAELAIAGTPGGTATIAIFGTAFAPTLVR